MANGFEAELGFLSEWEQHVADITPVLDVVESKIASGVLGTASLTDQARLAFAAHLTAQSNRTTKHGGGGIGAIAGRTLSGGQTVSYSAPDTRLTKAALESTRYGRILWHLLQGGEHRWQAVMS